MKHGDSFFVIHSVLCSYFSFSCARPHFSVPRFSNIIIKAFFFGFRVSAGNVQY